MGRLTWVPIGDNDYQLRNDPEIRLIVAAPSDYKLFIGDRLLHRTHSFAECIYLVQANFDGLEAGFNFGEWNEHGSELSPLPSGAVPEGS